MPNDQNILPVGTILNYGCYRIDKKLGQGGFGITYLATEIGVEETIGEGKIEVIPVSTKEKVVIKEMFYEDICSREDSTRRVTITNSEKKLEFSKLVEKQKQEGRYLRSLKHKNIVKNKKIFIENDTAYIVMEYLQGMDLSEVLEKTEKLSIDKTIKYIRQILAALQHVHQHNILHLDIKPSNIFILKSSDDAILIDFGASLSYNDDGKVKNTTSKLVSGISCYATVEQNDLDNLKYFDPTLDTFSLTGTFYHCITGVIPPKATLRISGRSNIVLPSDIDSSINDYYDAIIEKGLNLKYDNRFSSASEFLIALDNESVYKSKIQSAQTLIIKSQYEEALEELKIAEALIGPTKTTKSLIEKCKGSAQKEDDVIEYEKFYKLGLEFELKGNYENALAQFEKANSISANKAECIGKIENCKTKIEQRKKEEKIAQLWNTVHAENEAKNYENSLKYLQQILLFDPSNKAAIELKTEVEKNISITKEIKNLIKDAQTKEQKKEWEEAISIYKRILIYYPENELKKEIEKAIVNCQNQAAKTQVLNSTTNDKEFDKAYQKGIEFLKIEEYSQALSWFYTASRFNPENKEVKEKMSLCKSKLNESNDTNISTPHNSTREIINTKLSPEIESNKVDENNKSGNTTKILIGLGFIIIFVIGLYYTMSPKKATEVAPTSDSTTVVISDSTLVTEKQYPPTATDTIKSYTGKEYNNLPNGQGKATYNNGDTFEGEFKDGERVNGKYIWSDNVYYKGNYEKNALYNGTLFNADGTTQAEYVNGEQKDSKVISQKNKSNKKKNKSNKKKKNDTSNSNEEIYVDPWENNTQKSSGNGMMAK
jgi:serine/threonine protein kinase